MRPEQIENTFIYHAPTPEQIEKYAQLREMGKNLAYLIADSCPDSKEKNLAFTNLQQTIMWANAAIAINS